MKCVIINKKYSKTVNSYFLPTSDIYITIPIQKTTLRAKIDLADYKRVIQYKWWLTQFGHAYTNIKNRFVYLHRLVTNFAKHLHVDHINNNKLDCTSVNLRPATQHQNLLNKSRKICNNSKYKGVWIRKSLFNGNRYQAHIFHEGKNITLGTFDYEVDAAIAYNEAAKKYFGEFANLNVI